MANLLELKSLTKRYNIGLPNEVLVLDDINIALNRGEVVGLVAPSGTGKSTLLNIAGLLDQADSGAVYFAQTDVSQASDAERTNLRRDEIGFVFQFHHLLKEFTALENIALPLLNAGWAKPQAHERAQFLLNEVGLTDRANHRPFALSGGEAQRVAICRALANSPALLLADEPTGNLDPENANKIFELFMRLAKEEQLTALVATHNLELAHMMDRVVDLRQMRAKNQHNEPAIR